MRIQSMQQLGSSYCDNSKGKFQTSEDYNSRLYIDQYPLPEPDGLFVSLAGGQKFSERLILLKLANG